MYHCIIRFLLPSSLAIGLLVCLGGLVLAQSSTTLPTVHVIAPKPAKGESAAARRLAAKAQAFDAARSKLYTTVGTTSYKISHETIRALPQGANQPVEKVLLQAPGVSQDSAASGLLHVRNDHANVQFRINGVMLPDGVTGFGSIFDTSLIGGMSLVRGALPAEFGLRTVALVDIATRTDVFNNSGSITAYGGSFGTLEPSFEYGGTFGGNCGSAAPGPSSLTTNCFPGVQYYFTGRYLQTTVGIENPTPAYDAIHNFSQQEKGFAYMSALIDPTTRLSMIAGTATNAFQIPNVPGQPVGQMGNPPVTNAFGITNFNSALLNETQTEDTQFGVLALQKSVYGFDGQLSYFTRYNFLHFVRPGRRSAPQRHCLKYKPRILCQRHSRRHIVCHQPCERAPRWLHGQRRTEQRRQLVARRAVHDLRWHRQWRARDDGRQCLEARLACRHLCAGRVEDHKRAYDQWRPALRSDVAICRRQPTEPALCISCSTIASIAGTLLVSPLNLIGTSAAKSPSIRTKVDSGAFGRRPVGFPLWPFFHWCAFGGRP